MFTTNAARLLKRLGRRLARHEIDAPATCRALGRPIGAKVGSHPSPCAGSPTPQPGTPRERCRNAHRFVSTVSAELKAEYLSPRRSTRVFVALFVAFSGVLLLIPASADAALVYGPYGIHNVRTGKCVDIPGYRPSDATLDGAVQQYSCNDTDLDNQRFERIVGGGNSATMTVTWDIHSRARV